MRFLCLLAALVALLSFPLPLRAGLPAPRPARRVVTLHPGLSDILEAIGAGKTLVGRTGGDAGRGAVPAVGSHLRPNLELIAAAKPDLVLQLETGRGRSAPLDAALRSLGIPVETFAIRSFPELFAAMRRIGDLTGRDTEADEAVAGLEKRLEKASAWPGKERKRPRVFLETRYPNLLAAARDSMASAVIEAAGGVNAVEQNGMVIRAAEEALVALDPDIYLVQRGAMNKNPPPPRERPHFRQLRAVREGRVKLVEESLFSRPGPGNVQAVEDLALYFQSLETMD